MVQNGFFGNCVLDVSLATEVPSPTARKASRSNNLHSESQFDSPSPFPSTLLSPPSARHPLVQPRAILEGICNSVHIQLCLHAVLVEGSLQAIQTPLPPRPSAEESVKKKKITHS